MLKDFLHLRPVYHWTEQRVRGHIAICVYAAVIEALMAADLTQAGGCERLGTLTDVPSARPEPSFLMAHRLSDRFVGDR